MPTHVDPGGPPTRTDAIEEIVVAFIRDELGEAEVTSLSMEDNLLTSGLVDSVGILRLIGHLERRLGVKVPPQELVPENFRTIRTMSRFMLGRRYT
jgi:acyl carrier protein